MKTTFEVKATGSSMCGGRIASIRTLVDFDFDYDPISEFYEKAHSGMFRSGYNILHWGAINGVEAAKCLFVVKNNERLCRRILKHCRDYAWAAKALKAIKTAEAGNPAEGTFEYEGTYRYQGGWTKESLEILMRDAAARVSTINVVLEDLGYDPNDKEGIRRVCHNLGFDAIRGNGMC